jgi:adenylate cyclase
MPGVLPLFDWLIDAAPGARTSEDVIERLTADLVAVGVPVERMAALVTTLHPQVLGRAFLWDKGSKVTVKELAHGVQQSDGFQNSPPAHVMRTRSELRIRISPEPSADDFAVIRELAADGFTDYVGFPLPFSTGDTHTISFATRRFGGFEDEHLAVIRQVVRPLARVAEILALRRTAGNLLSTYVGRNAGDRILAGHILKGDIESLRAIIWFSDLRGFTEMSARMTPREVIDTLNELFDCQVPAIDEHGGEVLKFMGDGLLAIFPFTSDAGAYEMAAAALDAADSAFSSLAQRNRHAKQAIQFGLALHVGDIAYGNIGGASRLDFTAIGPAVNLAARIEGLTGKLGRPLAVSEALAKLVKRPLEEVGVFELKGVTAPQRVFVPCR